MRNSRAIAILSVMFGLGLFLVGGTLLFSPSNSYGQDIPGVKATPGEGDLIRKNVKEGLQIIIEHRPRLDGKVIDHIHI